MTQLRFQQHLRESFHKRLFGGLSSCHTASSVVRSDDAASYRELLHSRIVVLPNQDDEEDFTLGCSYTSLRTLSTLSTYTVSERNVLSSLLRGLEEGSSPFTD
jgi:hypothetical protein